MSQSLFLEYYPNAGGIRIENRDGVIWVSLTDIGRACGKFFWECKELESTKKFLTSLGSDRGFKLFETIQSGATSKRGTWAIEEVAIEFAGWCYPLKRNFQDWVAQDVLPSIHKTGSYSVQSQPQTTQLRLPAHKLAEEIAESIVQIQNNLSDNNSRLAQFLIDLAISEVMPAGNSLTGSKLKGVAEIAESLGLAVNLKNPSLLGKFVKKSCEHLAQQEERLVNGQQLTVACYPEDDPKVIDAIKAFFS